MGLRQPIQPAVAARPPVAERTAGGAECRLFPLPRRIESPKPDLAPGSHWTQPNRRRALRRPHRGRARRVPDATAPSAPAAQPTPPGGKLKIEKQAWGKTPDGARRRPLHADQRERDGGQDHQLRRHRHRAARPRQGRQAGRRRARLRQPRRLPRRATPTSAPSSAATPTASPRASSRSTARSTRSPRNNGPNHLHGGVKGFDKVVWKAEPVTDGDGPSVQLTYISPDGEEGYPGNLDVDRDLHADRRQRAAHRLHAPRPTRPTVVNLTNHTYFNLAGAGAGDILDHELMLNGRPATRRSTRRSSRPARSSRSRARRSTSRKPTPIGARIERDARAGDSGGYDHNFVLEHRHGRRPRASPRACASPTSGPRDGGLHDRAGRAVLHRQLPRRQAQRQGRQAPTSKHDGFCLETQHFPDSPNKPNFPSTVLKPGEKYQEVTTFKFSAK